jgi:hypothetical protein
MVGLKDLDTRSRFWSLWQDALLQKGDWCSFSLNQPQAPQGAAPLRSVLKFFGASVASDDGEEKDASNFCSALRNHRENKRRLHRNAAVPNEEKVWNMDKRDEKNVLSRLLSKDSFFVPIFGNALETTARRLVYRLMSETPLFPVTGVFPVTIVFVLSRFY